MNIEIENLESESSEREMHNYFSLPTSRITYNLKELSIYNEKFQILANQSIQERKNIIEKINKNLKKLPKLENFEIEINKIQTNHLNNNIDIQLIEKRKINNRKNTHRNYFKTIGRKILKYIESNNQKIQEILDKNSTNFTDFTKWIDNRNLYINVSNKNMLKDYLIHDDDTNKLIFKTICQEYMEKEAYFEIINMYRRKRIKKQVNEFAIESLYMDCNVAFARCLDNPKNFDYCFKDLIPHEYD